MNDKKKKEASIRIGALVKNPTSLKKASYQIHPTAQIHVTAVMGRGVDIGENCVIEEGVFLGEFAVLRDNVWIKKNSIIGSYTQIEQNVVINEDSVIGHYSTITMQDITSCKDS
ncbi:MAG: hypothetical protein OIF50_04755 [Flavobacteriaceae bacterium]|nr:hypothetical protein [Flavobacteriaceae bacterium]